MERSVAGVSTGESEAEHALLGATALEICGDGAGVDPAVSLPPSPSPFRAVGFMLSSLGHAVAARFSARLAPLSLEPREFALLRLIGAGEGHSQQAVGERLGIPASRMVALVDELEGRRLLERRPSPRDRRAHALHLTASGKRLLGEAIQLAAGLERELTQELDVAERAQLIELLDRVADRLGVPPGVHGSQVVG
jgi:DNA-binding MarR family transcriptional regulator